MSKPFKLTISDGYQNAHIGTRLHEDPEHRRYDFMRVKSLDVTHNYQLDYKVLTTSKIIQRYDVIWVDTPNDILLSSKAIQILNELCPEQFQVFDATIECKDVVLDTYKAINILNEVDVSDQEKRKFYYLSDNKTICGYERGGFVIKDQPMEPIHIGREKHSHATIIISATLKEAFEKAKVKGCQYWTGD
jgi:hypothetical protein